MLQKYSSLVKAYLKQYVPEVVTDALISVRGDLYYLEFHLADHCNLNCRACEHYSNIAEPKLAELAQFEADLRRLAKIFRNVKKIRLMGGEPLLHPTPEKFILTAREVFPKCDIRIVTNGVLLKRTTAKFWDACRQARAKIDLSLYPPFESLIQDWEDICRANGVALSYNGVVKKFTAHMNLAGDSDKAEAFKLCRSNINCPNLRNGRLYLCMMPPYIDIFNRKYRTEIVADPGVDLYDPAMTRFPLLSRFRIRRYLNSPVEMCKWCAVEFREMDWRSPKKSDAVPLSDWDASAPAEEPRRAAAGERARPPRAVQAQVDP